MYTLDDYKIKEHLPSSIDRQNIRDLAEVLDVKLQEINAMSEIVLLYPRIDELPENIIDALAEQFHVDFYDAAMTLPQKRTVVKNSIAWHRKKGTPSVVEEMVQTVFESAHVEEWFEYGGKPYFFRVTLITAPLKDKAVLDRLVDAINKTKNVRSWLEYVSFSRPMEESVYIGGVSAVHKKITMTSDLSQDQMINKEVFIGGVSAMYKTIEMTGEVD